MKFLVVLALLVIAVSSSEDNSGNSDADGRESRGFIGGRVIDNGVNIGGIENKGYVAGGIYDHGVKVSDQGTKQETAAVLPETESLLPETGGTQPDPKFDFTKFQFTKMANWLKEYFKLGSV